MKILVFNGSPRMKKSNTDKIVIPFLAGAKEAGADTEVIYLRNLRLQPCSGCLSCWFNTPGNCAIKDDIISIKDKFLKADIFILATPIYLFSSSSYLKILMERLFFPLTMPEYSLVDGRVVHPIRFPGKKWKSILITNGAFDGDDVFKPLMDTYKRMVKNVVDNDGKDAFISLACFTIGFGELFADIFIRSKCSMLFKSLKKAGKEVVENGYILKETVEAINKPIYEYAGMTREEAILRNNTLIEEFSSRLYGL